MPGKRSSARADWAKHIESWRESGLSQTGYCAKHGLGIKSFGRWKRIFDEIVGVAPVGQQDTTEVIPLIPVSIVPDTVVTPDGGKMGRQHNAGIQLHVGNYTVDLAVGFDEGTPRLLLNILH